jgi:hypothetical protein
MKSKCKMIFSLLSLFLIEQAIPPPAQSATTENENWNFQLAPYAWLAGQKGTLATLPGLPSADVGIDFYDDILGNINGTAMFIGEVRKDRFGVAIDVSFTNIEMDTSTTNPYFSSVTSRTKTWMVSTAAFYRLLAAKTDYLDLLAGVRYWSVDSKITIKGGSVGFAGTDNKEDWYDPMIGVKGLKTIGNSKFFTSGILAIGGFGAGSDSMWDANINLGYQWTKSISTTIGYRYLDVDYNNDGFIYDVSQDGPILGLSWRF